MKTAKRATRRRDQVEGPSQVDVLSELLLDLVAPVYLRVLGLLRATGLSAREYFTLSYIRHAGVGLEKGYAVPVAALTKFLNHTLFDTIGGASAFITHLEQKRLVRRSRITKQQRVTLFSDTQFAGTSGWNFVVLMLGEGERKLRQVTAAMPGVFLDVKMDPNRLIDFLRAFRIDELNPAAVGTGARAASPSDRVRLAFLEMPGLAANATDVAKVCRLEVSDATSALQSLVVEGFLSYTSGLYIQTPASTRARLRLAPVLGRYLQSVYGGGDSVNGLYLSTLERQQVGRKRILWVDDDSLGLAPFVAPLEPLDVRITRCGSTEEALRHDLAVFDLVISNLRRDEDEAAGIRLVRAIRTRSNVPIIIFTRPLHGLKHQDVLNSLRATLATSPQELFRAIAAHVTPSMKLKAEDHVLGQR